MKSFYTLIFVIAVLTLANFGAIKSSLINVKGISEYKNNNFTGSLDSFLGVGNLYNTANSYYELGDFQNAVDIYEELEEEKNYIYHNLGNSYYGLAHEEQLSIKGRIELLKKSLLNFESAQILKQDERTTKNIEIVKKELEDLELLAENPESETEQDNDDSESSSQGQGEEGEEGGEDENDDSESSSEGQEQNQGEEGQDEGEDGNDDSESSSEGQTGSEGQGEEGQGEEGGGGEGGSPGLSQEEQQAIDTYEQRLENEQGDYGQFYNKIYNQQNNDIDQIFGNDPFFDNGLLDDTETKDW